MALDQSEPETPASSGRREGLGFVKGLVNGIIFTLGIWLALMGLILLIFR